MTTSDGNGKIDSWESVGVTSDENTVGRDALRSQTTMAVDSLRGWLHKTSETWIQNYRWWSWLPYFGRGAIFVVLSCDPLDRPAVQLTLSTTGVPQELLSAMLTLRKASLEKDAVFERIETKLT